MDITSTCCSFISMFYDTLQNWDEFNVSFKGLDNILYNTVIILGSGCPFDPQKKQGLHDQ